MLRELLDRYATIIVPILGSLFMAASVVALGSSSGLAQSEEPRTFGKWSSRDKHDPLDGKATLFWTDGRAPGTTLYIHYSHAPHQFGPMHQYSITYLLGREMRCPHIQRDVPEGIAPSKSISVRWRIDGEPVHQQSYSLSCTNGRCASITYLWRVLSVEQEGYISRYVKLPNSFSPGSKFYEDHQNFYGLPADRMVQLMRKGKTLFLRASDQCESVDVAIDLQGLDEAMAAAGIGKAR